MKLMQILLSQSEAGAETYFEKVAAAFAQDTGVEQRLIIEALPTREQRLRAAQVDFVTLPMGALTRPLFYNARLKKSVSDFAPDLIVTWVNRASRKCPLTDAVVVGRLGGYYDVRNYDKCDHLIVNAPDLIRHVKEGGRDERDISLISNFGEIPQSLQVPDAIPDIPEDHTVLLALGRLHPKKAHDILIKALPQIPNSTLLLVGSGELEAELKALTISLELSDRVKFLGLRKDIYNLYQRADICVFPSRFEPLGNVVLEAWATSTPLVAAASQGPSWLVADGENGLLFPVDDVAACSEAVNRLIADTALQEKIKQNGLKKFQQDFSEEKIMAEYKKLFERLLTEKRDQGTK